MQLKDYEQTGTYRSVKRRGTRESMSEHVRVVEDILGKRLPEGAEVHHMDGNRRNNKPTNLVVCPDREYHFLLHRRQRALDACGNANWCKCRFCKEYDDPANMKFQQNYSRDKLKIYAGEYWHAACSNSYQNTQRRIKNAT